MFKTRRSMAIVAGLGVLALAVAAAFWVSRSGTVTGEIRDTAIVLSPDHAGAVVNVRVAQRRQRTMRSHRRAHVAAVAAGQRRHDRQSH